MRFAFRALTLIAIIIFWTFLDIVGYMYISPDYNGVSNAKSDVKANINRDNKTLATDVQEINGKQSNNSNT